MSLASRPKAFGLLEKLIELRYSAPLKTLRLHRYDAVHFIGTGWDYLGFAMHTLARGMGARFTIWPAVHPGAWGDDRLDLRLYNLADRVMCQSDDEVRHLEKQGLTASKAVRCGLPPMCLPDGDGASLRERLKLKDRPVVLFLGRRDEGKGYPALLRAWPKVLETHPEAVLMLAGPGGTEYTGEFRAWPADSLRDLAIPDEKTKADALAACTIFCLPSAHESFGIVYVEAWSYAKPVVCGPAPASRELVRANETGLWAEQQPDSIANAIIQLLNDPAESRRIGQAGQQFQKNHLTWDKIIGIHQAAFGLANQ